MKGGPGKADMIAVKYLFDNGKTLSEVSAQLKIHEEGLKPYAPASKPIVKKKAKKRVD